MANKTVSAKKNNDFLLKTEKVYEVVMARSHDLSDGFR